MNKMKLSVLIIFISLLLVSCQHSAKTEHWKIQVTGTQWVESTSAVIRLLEDAGYTVYNDPYAHEEGPYLAVSVILKNISGETMKYPDYFGTFDAFIADQQGNIFEYKSIGSAYLEHNSGTLIPGYSTNDIYVFAVSEYSGKLDMRIREKGGSMEVPISLPLPDVP